MFTAAQNKKASQKPAAYLMLLLSVCVLVSLCPKPVLKISETGHSSKKKHSYMGRGGTVQRGEEFGTILKSFKTHENSLLTNNTVTSLFSCVAHLKRRHHGKRKGKRYHSGRCLGKKGRLEVRTTMEVPGRCHNETGHPPELSSLMKTQNLRKAAQNSRKRQMPKR